SALARDVNFGGTADAALLAIVDRFLRRPGADRAASFHFDEDQVPALGRDEIDLGAGRTEIAIQYPVPTPLKIALGVPLAAPAEALAPLSCWVRQPPRSAEAALRSAPSSREASQIKYAEPT